MSSAIEAHASRVLTHRQSLVPALLALADEVPSGSSRRELQALAKRLEGGTTVAELVQDPSTLAWLPHLASVASGEKVSATLSDAIRHAAEETQLRTQRQRVWVYPITVIVLAFLVLTAISVMIVPSFRSMFEEFGIRLPASTQLLLWISSQLSDAPLVTLVGMAAASAITYFAVRVWNHYALSSGLLGFFFVGNSSSVRAMASMTAMLADMFDLGASTDEAFRFAGDQCGHRYYRTLSYRLANHCQTTHDPISDATWAKQLPANVIHAINAGPCGEPSVPLLRELSAMYRERLAYRAAWTGGFASHLATLVVGLVVFFVIISLFAPLVSLVSGLS
ncbi:type II secretion system F family protein [Novipirellula artificiosorum]|uniref:Type II secretion system protein F n=1 Tax=Novipirellula artificiosorum TaxID=2528016 RepID=A0A5C6DCP4_9BACT|nr:type II secretion system F family protein [Novipirellula artificiosorum]TWU32986.1 Type II secretion system protein F [Novipirellula artificiosorum]